MNAHDTYAFIKDKSIVTITHIEPQAERSNYDQANYLAKCVYGEDAIAVLINQYKCKMSDKYYDGTFWRVNEETGEETRLESLPTQEQQINVLQQTVSSLEQELNPTIDTNTCSLEELQEYTITQFGKACSSIIYTGSDVETERGTKHFSYKEEDQTNLSSAVNLAIMTGLDIPYHADGEDCCLWSAADIVNIYGTNELLKTHQTTYCNLMNGLIRSAENNEAVLAMKYGDPLPADKQVDLDAAIQQSQKVFQTLVNSLPAKSQ